MGEKRRYLIYSIFAVIFAFVVWFCSDNPDLFSIIANTSELLGLSITMTEIFLMRSKIEELKIKMESLQKYKDSFNVKTLIILTKDDISNDKYSKAHTRLLIIKEIFDELIPQESLFDTTSNNRQLYDTLLSTMDFISLNISKKHNTKVKNEHLSFLNLLDIEIVKIQKTSKKELHDPQ